MFWLHTQVDYSSRRLEEAFFDELIASGQLTHEEREAFFETEQKSGEAPVEEAKFEEEPYGEQGEMSVILLLSVIRRG